MAAKTEPRDTRDKVIADLKADYKNGFQFVAYVGQWRGWRYISEISGVKHQSKSLAGFSWQAGILTQRKLRWFEECLKRAQIPIEYITV